MKMMDVDSDNDCCIESITPAKKKMRQAQLPFQRSPVGSSNIMQSKKRKLSSPTVDYKSPKSLKISKKGSRKLADNNTLNDSSSDKLNAVPECVDIVEDTDAENLKENATVNKDESVNKNITPKRLSKKLEKRALISSPLTKFLKKPEKEADALKDESDDKADNVASQSSNSNQEMELNDSGSPNESYVTVVSSDNEEKDDPGESGENIEETTMEETSRKSINSSDVKTPKTDKLKQKKLTPKQQERQLMSAKKKEERERLKMEKEKKQEEDRENRRKEKEQKMLEKKLKEQKKQQELEQKQKEKQAKEEERRKREEAKEEEKRKKEEEKLEAERKKQKAASNFTSFFVAKKQEKTVDEESTNKVQNFMPFEVKADMKLAPICRRTLSEAEKKTLDENRNKEITKTKLYLSDLKSKRIVPRKSSKTWPLEAKGDDVILLDDDNEGNSNIVNQDIVIEKQTTKLLLFAENRRPPYWGTWRKRSQNINPRRPFSKDEKWFNYEVDSDDEWEEEEPGESLRGSDDEKDEENPDDNEYDVDNEFMVPHGYLSDEELRADEEDKEDMTPETQKFKLKVLGEQFESERNAKTAKLKPKIIGCVWRGLENSFSENVPPRTRDFLSSREAWVRQIPVFLPTSFENEAGTECGTPTQQSSSRSSKKSRFPAEAIPELIRLLHGNTHGRRFLIREFITFWNRKYKPWDNQILKGSLMHKIREIGKWMACPEEGPMHLRPCWYVSEEVRKQHLEEDLRLPNQWSYNLSPTRKRDLPEVEEKEDEKDKEKKNAPLITQFTKKITQAEMKKQLTASPLPANPRGKPVKKRVTLTSVARGEQFPKTAKDSPMKNFISNDKGTNAKDKEEDGDDDIIVLEEPSENRTATPEKIERENEEAVVVKKESEKKRKPVPKKLKTGNKKTKVKTTTKKSAKKAVTSSMDVEVMD